MKPENRVMLPVRDNETGKTTEVMAFRMPSGQALPVTVLAELAKGSHATRDVSTDITNLHNLMVSEQHFQDSMAQQLRLAREQMGLQFRLHESGNAQQDKMYLTQELQSARALADNYRKEQEDIRREYKDDPTARGRALFELDQRYGQQFEQELPKVGTTLQGFYGFREKVPDYATYDGNLMSPFFQAKIQAIADRTARFNTNVERARTARQKPQAAGQPQRRTFGGDYPVQTSDKPTDF
jgi:hypothetical protein